jgi:hypothetical protein
VRLRFDPLSGRSHLTKPSTALDVGPSVPWKEAFVEWLPAVVIFHLRTDFSHFLLPISRLAAAYIAAREYHCGDSRFDLFRRSAKAFPFVPPSTRFWPTRSTLLVAIFLT